MNKDFKKFADKYTDQTLMNKIKRYARVAGVNVIYAVSLLFYAMKDKDVSTTTKAIIVGALGYFVFPLDAVADFIPFTGYVDDLAVLTLALGQVSKAVTPLVKDNAKSFLENWFAGYDEQELVDFENLVKI